MLGQKSQRSNYQENREDHNHPFPRVQVFEPIRNRIDFKIGGNAPVGSVRRFRGNGSNPHLRPLPQCKFSVNPVDYETGPPCARPLLTFGTESFPVGQPSSQVQVQKTSATISMKKSFVDERNEFGQYNKHQLAEAYAYLDAQSARIKEIEAPLSTKTKLFRTTVLNVIPKNNALLKYVLYGVKVQQQN